MTNKALAVIGTAGRRDDASRLSPRHFELMVRAACQLAIQWQCDSIVSGGAAWADHAAVWAAQELDVPLILHVPCPFIGGQYADTGAINWRLNPGGTLNHYHRAFSRAMGFDSLSQLAPFAHAMRDWGSFHERNAAVAHACSVAVAFTFGDGKVKDGGTAHTCRIITAADKPLIHVSLCGERPLAAMVGPDLVHLTA